MKSTLDCLECFARQALRAARMATDDEAIQRRIVNDTCARIPHMDLNASPAALSMVCYELTARHSGNPDPYREVKREQNETVLALEPELRRLVAESPDPLETALHLSAAGNIIDLGTLHADRIDLREAIRQVLQERFAIDHGAMLRRDLAHCSDLLFFLDNAGEIVFDKILIEELIKHVPVTAVVKGGPMLNDAIMEDAVQVGLDAVCPIIDNGGAFIGSPLNLLSAAFLERMREADIILGKGQGNYETLDDFPGNVFLILRAKCEVIAAHMGVRFGQVALISTRARG
ncbi:MAG TPA: ARMT1-like domain-containing protein [Candidatus Hydrogenedentes bacterium]|nr:ARMT1-like domain-containing protein [Candidatus Hydrogenedentota bacterium]